MNAKTHGPVGDVAIAAKHRRPFLFALRPYFRQVVGLLAVGSLAGILMNVAIVLPAVFLGRAINAVLAYERHRASAGRSRHSDRRSDRVIVRAARDAQSGPTQRSLLASPSGWS
jgi:hypothetical protein